MRPLLPLLVASFLAGCAGASSSDGAEEDPVSSAPTASASVAGSEHCEAAPATPTYLPWLSSGERLPEPDASYGPGDTTTLTWVREDWPESSYVLLRRGSSRTWGGAGDEVAVGIPGADSAQFHEGEAPGMAFLVWETGEAKCGEIGLQLVALDMTRARTREEIVKVAKSLAT